MRKGNKSQKKRVDQSVSLTTLALEANLTPDQLDMMVRESGEATAKTICRSILRARQGGCDEPMKLVEDLCGKYGIASLHKLFPKVADPYTYLERVHTRLLGHIYDSICATDGWAWVRGELKSTDSDGQVVSRPVELGALIALDGDGTRGMLIAGKSRASYSIVNPRTWRPCEEDVENPPPCGWRIAMFAGDPENRVETTPIMEVAEELNQKVRDIKDLVDHTLVGCAISSSRNGSSRGWHKLGEFPEIGPPDLSSVTDPEVKRRLQIGLSLRGFDEDSPTSKVSPMKAINRLLSM